MRRIMIAGIAAVTCCLSAGATPSSMFWTNCSMDFQSPGLTHITYDTYGTLGSGHDGESFPTDYGLTFGAKLGSKISAEYGIDYFAAVPYPAYFNAKIGYAENALQTGAPAVELGVFNVGTKSGITDQNVVQFLVGKSLPNNQGRLHASYYVGNSKVLRNSDGDRANTGFMVGYDRSLVPNKVGLAVDYASGKNAIGGGGVGVSYSFNPNVSLLGGPVWFNDKGINGKMKWSLQLDVNY